MQEKFVNFETDFVLKDYQDSIIRHMKKRDKETKSNESLKNHSITKMLRAKMIDWMIEVLCSYKCKD